MYCKAALLAVTLALLAAANPVEQVQGISIPLAKRSSLTRGDGTFNHEKAVLQVVATKNKHRQNLINLERNLGKTALNQGAEIKPVAIPPTHLHRRESEPLIDEDQDREWAGNVGIGTPNRGFLIDFDTGSADFWVPSSDCTSSTCSAKQKYNVALSSTSAKHSGIFSILYGDGSTVSGPIYTDTVNVAGVQAINQTFSAVTTLSSSFSSDPADGILGLAFPALSTMNADPFFVSAFKQKAVHANEFSFKLARNGSSLFLGGADSSLYTGYTEFHTLSGSGIPGFWQISNAAIFLNSKSAASNFHTIIDSGTTLIYGPPSAVDSFYARIPGSALYDLFNGFYSFPCSSVPSVSFSWGGNKWAITAANFNLGPIDVNATHCAGALAGMDLGLGTDVWLLGDSFMKNVYTTFSFTQNAIGFSTLA